MQPLQYAAGDLKPALGAAAGLGRWLVGDAILLNAVLFQMWRRCSTTTAHRTMLVCQWPALGMPWATASSNEDSAVCSKCDGAGTTWCCSLAGQLVCCGGCNCAECLSFPDMEALLGNHSAQNPASVWVASSLHTMDHCKEVKFALCIV